jgi:hypothetical protein
VGRLQGIRRHPCRDSDTAPLPPTRFRTPASKRLAHTSIPRLVRRSLSLFKRSSQSVLSTSSTHRRAGRPTPQQGVRAPSGWRAYVLRRRVFSALWCLEPCVLELCAVSALCAVLCGDGADGRRGGLGRGPPACPPPSRARPRAWPAPWPPRSAPWRWWWRSCSASGPFRAVASPAGGQGESGVGGGVRVGVVAALVNLTGNEPSLPPPALALFRDRPVPSVFFTPPALPRRAWHVYAAYRLRRTLKIIDTNVKNRFLSVVKCKEEDW